MALGPITRTATCDADACTYECAMCERRWVDRAACPGVGPATLTIAICPGCLEQLRAEDEREDEEGEGAWARS